MKSFPLIAFLVGLATLYIGERSLEGTPRSLVSGFALFALLIGLGSALLRTIRADGSRKQATRWIFVSQAITAVGLLIYVIQSDWLLWISEGKLFDLARLASPLLIILGGLPAVAMEFALRSMHGAPEIELSRVSKALRGALILTLTLVTFTSVNFVANRWNRKVDLSYFKTTEPSASTRALVEKLSSKVEMILFYPRGNEVLTRLLDYTSELEPLNENFEVTVVDQALEPALAKELSIQGNGNLVLRRSKNVERLSLSTELTSARKTLRDLDGEIQKRLLRITRPDRVAYFTSGHLERRAQKISDDERIPIADLRSLFEGLGFEVQELGLADGLGETVPEDATVVVIPGPLENFLPGERAALSEYFEDGGNLVIALEPDHGDPDLELLEMIGLTMSKHLVASKTGQIRIPGRPLSPYAIATSQSNFHPVSESYRRSGRRLAFAVMGAGALNVSDNSRANLKTTMVITSEVGAYVDENSDGNQQESEVSGVQTFVAAVEGVKPPEAEQAEDAQETEETETESSSEVRVNEADKVPGKAIVIGDADSVADGILRNPGNAFLMADALRWITDDVDLMQGPPTSEADIQIMHRKDEDKIWFYGTTMASPAIVLALGLTYTWRRRRRYF